MRRLFNDKTNYTPEAHAIHNEAMTELGAIIRKYKDVDPRDLELVIRIAADHSCLEMILNRKG